MRVNAAPERYDFAGEKRRKKTPRRVYHETGAFPKKKKSGHLAPRGDTKHKKKTHTPLKTRGVTKNQEKKPTPHRHTGTAKGSSRCLSCRNPAASTKKPAPTRHPSPIKALTIHQTLGKACVVLVKRRPQGRARRPQFPRLTVCFAVVAQNMYLPTSQAFTFPM